MTAPQYDDDGVQVIYPRPFNREQREMDDIDLELKKIQLLREQLAMHDALEKRARRWAGEQQAAEKAYARQQRATAREQARQQQAQEEQQRALAREQEKQQESAERAAQWMAFKETLAYYLLCAGFVGTGTIFIVGWRSTGPEYLMERFFTALSTCWFWVYPSALLVILLYGGRRGMTAVFFAAKRGLVCVLVAVPCGLLLGLSFLGAAVPAAIVGCGWVKKNAGWNFIMLLIAGAVFWRNWLINAT